MYCEFFFNDTATTVIDTLTHSFPTRRSSDLHPFHRLPAELVEVDLHCPVLCQWRVRLLPVDVPRHELVQQPHAKAGCALVPRRAGFIGPHHPGDVQMRPFDAVIDESPEEL